jgi:hypothetical protein
MLKEIQDYKFELTEIVNELRLIRQALQQIAMYGIPK